MSLIPKHFIDAVVAIGVQQSCNEYLEKVWIGTGFLVKKQEPNNNLLSTIYLITNKHVFNNNRMIYLRFNCIYGTFVKDYEIQLIDAMGRKLYTEHPDCGTDIVAMQLNPNCLINDNSIWGAISLELEALDLYAMKNTGVDEGCLVYALGFPMRLVGDFKTPICRLGCISRISDAFLQPNKVKSFLVDAQAFPGNSGGPIISRPENISLVGTANNFRANLIGILSAYIPYKDVLISQQTQEIRMVQTENSGLTIVHPVDRIKEVVLLEWDRNRVYFPNNFITYNNETDKKEVDKVLEERNDIIETNNIVDNENKL